MGKVLRSTTRIAFAIFVALTLFNRPERVGKAGVSPQSNPNPPNAPVQDEPLAVWSIRWTSTLTFDDSDYGENYHYTNFGSTLFRIFSGGGWLNDNVDFRLHVADQYERSTRFDCGTQGAVEEYFWHQSTNNPDAYDGHPIGIWNIQPYKNPDDSWSANFSGPGDLGTYWFTSTIRIHETYCYGGSRDEIGTTPPRQWENHCFPKILTGNAQGTEFTGHAGGSDFVGACWGPNGGISYGGDVNWSADVTARLLRARDLTVDHLEVTQGLQDGANSIPLVHGRRTVVRAFINIGTNPGPVNGVPGVLEVYAGEAKLGEVEPFNPNRRIDAPSHPDWKNINDTLNFELSPAWTLLPSLRLVVKVNPDYSISESNFDNNELTADVRLRPCNSISIGYTPIHYTPPGGYIPADPRTNIQVAQAFMQKIFPVSDDGIIYTPLLSMPFPQSINDPSMNHTLVEMLGDMLRESNPLRLEHIFGWLPSLAYDHHGMADLPGAAAFGNDTEWPNRWRRTFAHEVGHNLGLRHANLTTAGAHWFDVYDKVIKPGVAGGNLLDFMVPDRLEAEAWISPQNYYYLLNRMCSAASIAASTQPGSPQVGDNLLVSGIISNTTPAAGALNPLFSISTAPTTTLTLGSQYCLNLKDASGNLLKDYCFNTSFDGDSEIPSDAATFGMVVPKPASLQRVDLTQTMSGSVLSSQVASAHPPSVTVTFPNAPGVTLAGNQTLTWTGSDQDGDPLTYDILYSRDNGVTWMGAGAGILGTSYALDFSTLPGTSGASGLIKVLASDGFDSAEDTSDNPFTVGDKAPIASILSPSSGATFYIGSQIVLNGSGTDLEEWVLGGSALSWASSLDGAVGNGPALAVTLSPGVHTITLTVTDGQGQTDADSIQVTVVQSSSQQYLYLPLIRR